MSECTHDCSTCSESCGERKEANVFEKKPLHEGCRVGKGAVVAAGAVVVSDVAPNTVVAGVPARVLKDKDGKTAEKTALIDALRAL